MKRRTSFYLIFFILAVLLILKSLSWFQRRNNDTSSFRNTTHLIFTKHAKCRMDCRHITKEEIQEILESGKVNYAKSGVGSKGDSTFALEGYSHENQHIRVVVAPERDGLVIITCIDLGHEWQCNCN